MSVSNKVDIRTELREKEICLHFDKICLQFTIVGIRKLSRVCRILPTVTKWLLRCVARRRSDEMVKNRRKLADEEEARIAAKSKKEERYSRHQVGLD